MFITMAVGHQHWPSGCRRWKKTHAPAVRQKLLSRHIPPNRHLAPELVVILGEARADDNWVLVVVVVVNQVWSPGSRISSSARRRCRCRP
jgi:hypothetical protein